MAPTASSYWTFDVSWLTLLGQLVKDIIDVYNNYSEIHTEVIAASIRYTEHCLRAAKIGAHIATVPYEVLMQMTRHPLTETGISRFLSDWQQISKE